MSDVLSTHQVRQRPIVSRDMIHTALASAQRPWPALMQRCTESYRWRHCAQCSGAHHGVVAMCAGAETAIHDIESSWSTPIADTLLASDAFAAPLSIGASMQLRQAELILPVGMSVRVQLFRLRRLFHSLQLQEACGVLFGLCRALAATHRRHMRAGPVLALSGLVHCQIAAAHLAGWSTR